MVVTCLLLFLQRLPWRYHCAGSNVLGDEALNLCSMMHGELLSGERIPRIRLEWVFELESWLRSRVKFLMVFTWCERELEGRWNE